MSRKPTPSRQVSDGMRALREIQWMARRMAAHPMGAERLGLDPALPHTDPNSVQYQFNTATFLLEETLARYGFTPCKPDGTANRQYIDSPTTGPQVLEFPSIWADFSVNAGFLPSEEVLAGIGEDEVGQLQYAVHVIHPLAHRYADGRATYATSMFNEATRALRAAGFTLGVTEAAGRSVWVADGFGDGYDGLLADERAERDAARGLSADASTESEEQDEQDADLGQVPAT